MSKRKMNQRSLDALRAHAFRRGHDPRRNVGGRPKKPMTAALLHLAGEVAPGGETTFAERAAMAVFESAIGGSTSAFEAVRDTIEGKPRQDVAQKIDLDVNRPLPPLTEEEFKNGLGPGRGFPNEYFLRMTDDQCLRKMKELVKVWEKDKVQ
jgi:hypothetical protein